MTDQKLLHQSFTQLFTDYPYIKGYFESLTLKVPGMYDETTFTEWVKHLDEYELEQKGLRQEELSTIFLQYIKNMEERIRVSKRNIDSITIIGGKDKAGNKEDVTLELKRGDVISIVGPTGSGKSRLLGDIEWLAQKDTPTGRQILINGEIPPQKWRLSIEHKLVAQLSQNMNFVMDIPVGEFIRVHCESRLVGDFQKKKEQIMEAANSLAGEPILEEMPVTALSGGQSRALMIADTAYLSSSPIVLIDEIENAGINRQTAVKLLMKAEKIILIATHDPVLALSADKRIVIKNGAMHKIIETSKKEKEKLVELEEINKKLLEYRELIKMGKTID